jgi:hypothetical protein
MDYAAVECENDKLKLEVSRLDAFNLALYRVYSAAKRLKGMQEGSNEYRKLIQEVRNVERFIKGD